MNRCNFIQSLENIKLSVNEIYEREIPSDILTFLECIQDNVTYASNMFEIIERNKPSYIFNVSDYD